MRFRSGRRTNGKGRAENLPELKATTITTNLIKKENDEGDTENAELHPGPPAKAGSSSGLQRTSVCKREVSEDSELENMVTLEQFRIKGELFDIKIEPMDSEDTVGDCCDEEDQIPALVPIQPVNMDNYAASDGTPVADLDSSMNMNSLETQELLDPAHLPEEDVGESTESDGGESDKENDQVQPCRKRSRRPGRRRNDSESQLTGRGSKRRVSFDMSDMDASAPDESQERKKRSRSNKLPDSATKTSKKGKANDLGATSMNQCSLLEPSVKIPKEESRANLEAKTKSSADNNGAEEGDQDLEDDTEYIEGTLVVWEGPPHEPLFKKKAPKPGRFYIVNCGEAKGSSLNAPSGSSNLPTSCPQPAEIPAPPTCSCCASGCQFGNHGIITGETSKRVSRRRPKGPKKVQLVTKEEHHKILSSYIEDKKYEPDFKVDSLFANQVDQSQQGAGEAGNRRTRLQNKMGKGIGRGKQNEGDGAMEEEQVVSFTVKGNPELVDDVAGYEMVDSNSLLQRNGEQQQNPEFGIQLGQDDFIMDQRQKRPYRMRKLPSKEIQGEITCDPSGKPRCTYTDLIEKALIQSNGGLTVSEIYNWISTNYPYFQANDDRWKNSVRHNLSINPYFKKGDKARNGAGHLWVISEDGKGIRPPIRRKSGADNILDAICIENGEIIPIRNETDRAISVILSEYAMASMQHQNSQHEEESPVTYIQIPNDIAIGGGDDGTGQVICYENLPDGSYAIDVQEPNGQENQMYTISDFSEGNVIIVNPDDANKENVNGHQMMDDVVVSDFSVLNNDGGMLTNGRMSAPPIDNSSMFGGHCPKQNRPLSRSSSLPTATGVETQGVLMDNSSPHMNGDGSTQELTMLNTVSVADQEAMDAIGIVPGPQDATQVIEIMGDHLFDAKELGMVYEYDNHGDPLFL